MIMSKQATNIRLSPITLGYLHYLVQEGETQFLYEIIDVLVANYMEYIAEENELDMEEINKEAMILYRATRKSHTKRSKQEQENMAKKAMERLKGKSQHSDNAALNQPLDDVFSEEWGDE